MNAYSKLNAVGQTIKTHEQNHLRMNDFEWWFRITMTFVPLAFLIAVGMVLLLRVFGL